MLLFCVLDWISFFFCCCFITSFNLDFILRESRVAHFVCFSFSVFVFGLFGTFCTCDVEQCCKENVCLDLCCGWLSHGYVSGFYTCSLSSCCFITCAVPQHSSRLSLLPLNSRSFYYKTFFVKYTTVQNDRDFRVERMFCDENSRKKKVWKENKNSRRIILIFAVHELNKK